MSIHIKVTLPYLFLLQNKKKEHTTLCMFSFCKMCIRDRFMTIDNEEVILEILADEILEVDS